MGPRKKPIAKRAGTAKETPGRVGILIKTTSIHKIVER
jgi:hypothetical protein